MAKSKSGLQVLPIRPWHTIEKELQPYQCMVREIMLMSIIIHRDWLFDDVTASQNAELIRISKQLSKIGKRLHLVFDEPKTTVHKTGKAVVQSGKKARKKTDSKKN